MSSHPLLPIAARLGAPVSRAWLARRGNPYLAEIDAVARLLGVAGPYLLNIIYEWACSPSAAPDPRGGAARLIRVLDWGLTGLGRHVVIAQHETPHGPFFNVTWPGYAGVLTAMAPGRFAAAINQAPRIPITGALLLDETIAHLRMLCRPQTLPPAHLLRQVFEDTPDFSGALARLDDNSLDLAAPAILTTAGTEPHEASTADAT